MKYEFNFYTDQQFTVNQYKKMGPAGLDLLLVGFERLMKDPKTAARICLELQQKHIKVSGTTKKSMYGSTYWNLIRWKVQSTRRVCAHCDKELPFGAPLQIHHTCYDNVCLEYFHLDDLELLCPECHAAHHGH